MVEAQPRAVQINNWQVAETNAAEWMRYWGYGNARVTPPGPDDGLDVVAFGAVAQVKYLAAAIGRQPLQQLVGAEGVTGRHMFFFTGSSYSRHALEYAERMGIALFVYDLHGRMTPMSTAAEQVVANANPQNRARTEQSPAAPAEPQLAAQDSDLWNGLGASFGVLTFLGAFMTLFVSDSPTAPNWVVVALLAAVSATGFLIGAYVSRKNR